LRVGKIFSNAALQRPCGYGRNARDARHAEIGVKVVVWNMAHRVASWGALADLGADVALLCEARLPRGRIRSSVLGGLETKGRDGYPRPRGTAIVSPHDIREIDDARASRAAAK
jgi:hypothetical protein